MCLFVWLCLYRDVCPDDLTMKDWCHTNNILQVHCWGCLVVQVMFHTLGTSSMTSPGHKVGQILKLIYIRQYLSWSVHQKLKILEMVMTIFLVYTTSGITSAEKGCRDLKMAVIYLLNTASIWPQIWRDRPKLYHKNIFHDDDVTDDVTGWPKSRPAIFFL